MSQGTVSVVISNFKNNKGVCQVCLFDNAKAFDGHTGKPVACKKVSVENNNASATFNALPGGYYAVMTFHDANNNNKMDTNFLGIPSEGYGASKNKLPFAAAPTFNGNKFYVPDNGVIRLNIRLRNL